MSNVLELRGLTGASAAPADGELLLDEAGRLLATMGPSGQETIPLAIAPLPAGGRGSDILLESDTGVVWGQLSAGGGGRPFDDAAWRVPGLIPTDYQTVPFSAGESVTLPLELSQARTLSGSMVRASGTGAKSFAIKSWDLATTLLSHSFATTAIDQASHSLALGPGRYALVFTATDAADFQALVGFMPWSTAALSYPVLLGFL